MKIYVVYTTDGYDADTFIVKASSKKEAKEKVSEYWPLSKKSNYVIHELTKDINLV